MQMNTAYLIFYSTQFVYLLSARKIDIQMFLHQV